MIRSWGTALAALLLVALTGCAPAYLTPSAFDEPATPSDRVPSSVVEPLQEEHGENGIVPDVDSSRLVGTRSGVDVYLMESTRRDYYCVLLFENDESWVQTCSTISFTVGLGNVAEVRVDIPGTLLDDEWVRLDENVSVRATD